MMANGTLEWQVSDTIYRILLNNTKEHLLNIWSMEAINRIMKCFYDKICYQIPQFANILNSELFNTKEKSV